MCSRASWLATERSIPGEKPAARRVSSILGSRVLNAPTLDGAPFDAGAAVTPVAPGKAFALSRVSEEVIVSGVGGGVLWRTT